MGREEVAGALSASGIPFAYKGWGRSEPPPEPYALYRYVDGSGTLRADNGNYSPVSNWAVELYTDRKDEAAEGAVEEAIASLGCGFSKHESPSCDAVPSVTYLFATPG